MAAGPVGLLAGGEGGVSMCPVVYPASPCRGCVRGSVCGVLEVGTVMVGVSQACVSDWGTGWH